MTRRVAALCSTAAARSAHPSTLACSTVRAASHVNVCASESNGCCTVRADPDERHNLAATHSALVEKMAAMLGSYQPYVDVGPPSLRVTASTEINRGRRG